MAVMSTTAIILMCVAQHMTDNDKFSIAFLPIILAIFVYCGALADDY